MTLNRLIDSLGHQIGDEFLKVIAARLSSEVDGLGTVFRLGGDEFMVILDAFNCAEQVSLISQSICRQVNKSMQIEQYELKASCSIGVCVAPDFAEDFNMALKYADIAVYKAKSLGRNRVFFVDDSLIADSKSNFELQQELKKSSSI